MRELSNALEAFAGDPDAKEGVKAVHAAREDQELDDTPEHEQALRVAADAWLLHCTKNYADELLAPSVAVGVAVHQFLNALEKNRERARGGK